jgi:ATP-dependent protease HslVU (ClpYQ) peptidase subunit
MTTILAIQGDGFAAIGSDSQWTDDYGRVGKMNQPKVVQVGRYMIGVAGDTRGANIIQHIFTPPALPVKLHGAKLTKFIVSNFVPAYKEIMEAHGIGRPQYDGEPARTSVETLVVANGVIFQIDEDYGTEMDSNRLYAVGSGGHFGLGALQALTEKKKLTIPTCKQVLLKSLAIAAKFDQGTGAPFHTFIQQGSNGR